MSPSEATRPHVLFISRLNSYIRADGRVYTLQKRGRAQRVLSQTHTFYFFSLLVPPPISSFSPATSLRYPAAPALGHPYHPLLPVHTHVHTHHMSVTCANVQHSCMLTHVHTNHMFVTCTGIQHSCMLTCMHTHHMSVIYAKCSARVCTHRPLSMNVQPPCFVLVLHK